MPLHLFKHTEKLERKLIKPNKTKAGDLVAFNLYDEITENTITITDYGTLKNLKIALNELNKRGYKVVTMAQLGLVTTVILEKKD